VWSRRGEWRTFVALFSLEKLPQSGNRVAVTGKQGSKFAYFQRGLDCISTFTARQEFF
jgi:hypothetical protein